MLDGHVQAWFTVSTTRGPNDEFRWHNRVNIHTTVSSGLHCSRCCGDGERSPRRPICGLGRCVIFKPVSQSGKLCTVSNHNHFLSWTFPSSDKEQLVEEEDDELKEVLDLRKIAVQLLQQEQQNRCGSLLCGRHLPHCLPPPPLVSFSLLLFMQHVCCCHWSGKLLGGEIVFQSLIFICIFRFCMLKL